MPEKTTSPSKRARNRVYAQLRDDEFLYFQKAKEKIRMNLVEQHICLPNQNISQTEVLKVLVNSYCSENIFSEEEFGRYLLNIANKLNHLHVVFNTKNKKYNQNTIKDLSNAINTLMIVSGKLFSEENSLAA